MKPIAVTGVGALFPGNTEPDGFWRTIFSGQDCLTDIPESHWLIGDYYDPDPTKPGKTYARRGAFLSPVAFEPLEHGIPPNQAPSTDTAQLLALMVAKRVLENSCGLQFRNVDPERISVILGVASATELVSTMSGSLQRPVLVKPLRESGIPEDEAEEICARVAGSYVEWTESTFPGLLGNVVAGRIANRFDLGGTNCVVDAACASSLAAIQMARDEAAKRGSRCNVRAMSWGPWDGGMVTPDLRSHFAARGVSLISMEQGVAAFMQELCHTSTDPAGIDVVIAAQPAHGAQRGQ